MFHRRCQDRIHTVQGQLTSSTAQCADLTGTVEALREKLAAAADREDALRREIDDLQCRINDLEEEGAPLDGLDEDVPVVI